MEKVAFEAYIRGIVQGVGFRYFVYREAHNLNITGYVQNLPDGRVKVYAEGYKEQLTIFADHLKTGPRFSIVDDLEINWKPFQKKYDHFFIETNYDY